MTKRIGSKLLLYSVVPVFAVLITLLTGLGYVYGRPLPWILGGCPPPSSPAYVLSDQPPCYFVARSDVSYDWSAFVLDVLFYAAVGYGLLFGYARYHAGKAAGFSPRQN